MVRRSQELGNDAKMNQAPIPPSPMPAFVAFDAALEATRIESGLRAFVEGARPRHGLVVRMNGDVETALCAVLAVRAVGPDAVFGLMLPERESSSGALLAGVRWAEQLGIDYDVQDITSLLEVIGCYRRRDETIRHVVPEFRGGWTIRSISIVESIGAGGPVQFAIDAIDADGRERRVSFAEAEYRAMVAAASLKQRTRAMIAYYHADRLQYAVVGSADRLRYSLGLVAKVGDAAADVMPIAHLYRAEIHELARHLGVPANSHDRATIASGGRQQRDWTEWSLSLPRDAMDGVLRAREDGNEAGAAAQLLGLRVDQVERAFGDIERGGVAAAFVHQPPRLIERAASTRARGLDGH